jgi:hypothetical protein
LAKPLVIGGTAPVYAILAGEVSVFPAVKLPPAASRLLACASRLWPPHRPTSPRLTYSQDCDAWLNLVNFIHNEHFAAAASLAQSSAASLAPMSSKWCGQIQHYT